MIRELLDLLFDTSRYRTEHARFRANVIYAVTAIIGGFYLIYAAFVSDWPVTYGAVNDTTTMLDLALTDVTRRPSLVFYAMIALTAVALTSNRYAWTRVARWSPIMMWFVSGVLLTVVAAPHVGIATGPVVIVVLLGGLLVGRNGIILTIMLSILVIGVRAFDDPGFINATDGPALTNVLLQIIGSGLLVRFFYRDMQVARTQTASELAAGQSGNALVLRQIAMKVAQRSAPREMLRDVVSLIQAQSDAVTNAQVYLRSDDGYKAELIAATSRDSQQLVAEGYAIMLGTNNVISRVMDTGGATIESLKANRFNPGTPEVAVQMLLPLRIGQKTLGVLELQSTDMSAFDDASALSVFQGLADSLALAIDNVIQYQRAEEQQLNNEKLIAEAQEALREVERLNERMTGSVWSEYLSQARNRMGLSLDFERNQLEKGLTWTPSQRDAMQINQIVQDTNAESDYQVIAVPLRVRGRVVGAMEFELPKEQSFSPDDFDLLQEVGERFGLAVENARLVDESQRRARREAHVNLVTSRLQTTNTVDAMLNEAAQGLREMLQADRVAIRLGTPPLPQE